VLVSYEAIAQGVEADQIVARLLSTVPAPRLTPTQDASARPVPPAPGGDGGDDGGGDDGEPRLVWSA
jgi:hypothetical protein